MFLVRLGLTLLRTRVVVALILLTNIALTVSVILYPSPFPSPHIDDDYLLIFAHITDTHLPKAEEINNKAIEWIAQNNISLVIHTGDLVDNPNNPNGWKLAYEYMHKLDNSTNWIVLAGNHDVAYGTYNPTIYNQYFGNTSETKYCLIEENYLFIFLDWSNQEGSITKQQLEQMDQILKFHPERKAIICLHPHLFGLTMLNILGTPNYGEVWSYINRHDNVIMTLCGHIHFNWIQTYQSGNREIWSISTEALKDIGYIRLFNVYPDRIEVYAYSPWTNQTFNGPLDRFTIYFRPKPDLDGDLWDNTIEIMPTHPLVPNIPLLALAISILMPILSKLIRARKQS